MRLPAFAQGGVGIGLERITTLTAAGPAPSDKVAEYGSHSLSAIFLHKLQLQNQLDHTGER
jgi:hypothetical protein